MGHVYVIVFGKLTSWQEKQKSFLLPYKSNEDAVV